MTNENRANLYALLEFYAQSGVDCAVDEAPHDFFKEAKAQQAALLQKQTVVKTSGRNTIATPKNIGNPPLKRASTPKGDVQKPIKPISRPPDTNALTDAREVAANAKDLVELRQALERFDGCNLKRTAKNLVFGDGNPRARLMFVGEAPGRDEDLSGIPFFGRSGQLLNQMLKAIGFEREEDVYIANVMPWRPPGNRTPTPQETELCRPFIERQIAIVNPDLLVPLGGAATKQLFNTQDGILKLRGKFRPFSIPERDIEAMATLHPAYLLRQPAQKRLAWQDMLKIKRKLSDNPIKD